MNLKFYNFITKIEYKNLKLCHLIQKKLLENLYAFKDKKASRRGLLKNFEWRRG